MDFVPYSSPQNNEWQEMLEIARKLKKNDLENSFIDRVN